MTGVTGETAMGSKFGWTKRTWTGGFVSAGEELLFLINEKSVTD